MMEDWSFIDPKKAFEEALEAGILSDKEGDKNFVGDFFNYAVFYNLFSFSQL